jgi:hypothetical protein
VGFGFEAFDRELYDRLFESRQVAYLLRALGLRDRTPAVRRLHRTLFNEPGLAFASFRQAYPTFPARLIFRSLYRGERRDDCRLDALLRDFRGGIIYRLFRLYRDRFWADGCPCGVVFPFGGTPHGLVVHDGDFGARGNRLRVPDGSSTLTLEPFADLVGAVVAGGWTPRSAAPVSPRRVPAWGPSTGQIAVTPALVRLVGGPGAEVLVLGLLAGLTLGDYRDGAGTDHLRVRDGEPWVALGQAEFAELTGLSPDQVKRAVAGLVRKGLVERRQFLDPGAGVTISHFRVSPEALSAL